MKYLLDVNALIAWRYVAHVHHSTFHRWAVKVGFANLHTCAHTELGFLRVSMQTIGCTRQEADTGLAMIRKQAGGFVAECPPPKLAAWANTGSKTSDAYLCQLAAANKLQLATFDNGIKDAAVFLIS
jgi:predicted nucleic acid-binding protein